MRIGMDAKRAFMTRTGLGEYGRRLIDGLAQYGPSEWQFYLYTPGQRITWQPPSSARVIQPLRQNAVYGAWWRQWTVGKSASRTVHLFHGLSNELPLNLTIPAVVTIHDVLFKEYPRWFPWIDRQIYDWKVRRAVQRADRIICVSRATEQALVRYYPEAAGKTVIVPPMVPESLFHWTRRATPFSDRRPYLVFLGRMEERKNFPVVLKALQLLPTEVRPGLVSVAGENRFLRRWQAWARKHLPDLQWRHLSDVDNKQIWTLLKGSLALIYPSLAEGFGMPVAEAGALGVPVVTGTHPALREAGGPGALYVNVRSPEAVAEAIARLMKDTGLRTQLSRAGQQHARRFVPAQLVPKIVAAYEALV